MVSTNKKEQASILATMIEDNLQTNRQLWDEEVVSCYTQRVKELYLSLQKLPRNKATYSFLYLLSQSEEFAYYELISSLNPERNDLTVAFLQELKEQPENWQSLQLKYHLERTVKGFRYHEYISY